MNAITKQMEEHGVNRDRYSFASFVTGRGWKPHKSYDCAVRAVFRDAGHIRRQFGGGMPYTVIVRTDTGKEV